MYESSYGGALWTLWSLNRTRKISEQKKTTLRPATTLRPNFYLKFGLLEKGLIINIQKKTKIALNAKKAIFLKKNRKSEKKKI